MTDTPQDDIELVYVPTDAVVPYENNPRINDHAVQEMAAVIETHGFVVPILVAMEGDTIHMVDGHLRQKAAKALGMEEMPAIDVSGKTEREIAAMRIATNRAAELADWDPALLTSQVDALELKEDDMLGMTGFLADELPRLPPEPVEPPSANVTGETVNRTANPPRVQTDTDMVNLTLRMTVAQRRAIQADIEKVQAGTNHDSAGAVAVAAVAAMREALEKPENKKRVRTRKR